MSLILRAGVSPRRVCDSSVVCKFASTTRDAPDVQSIFPCLAFPLQGRRSVCRLSRQVESAIAFHKCSQLFIGAHDESLSVTVCVNDPDVGADAFDSYRWPCTFAM